MEKNRVCTVSVRLEYGNREIKNVPCKFRLVCIQLRSSKRLCNNTPSTVIGTHLER